jgi:hypothetical protein
MAVDMPVLWTAPAGLPTTPWATLRVVHMPTATATTSSCRLRGEPQTAWGGDRFTEPLRGDIFTDLRQRITDRLGTNHVSR